MAEQTTAPLDRGTADFQLEQYLAGYECGPGAGASDEIGLAAGVSRMCILDSPFTFGIIDDFLPAGDYRTALRDWPASQLAPVILPGGSDGYLGSRTTELIQDWQPGQAEPKPSSSWLRLSAALRSPSFVRPLFQRFAPVIEANLAGLDDPPGDPGFRLYLNCDAGRSEALGAHVDSLRKLLTVVLYLELSGELTEASPRQWGTALYPAEAGAYEPVRFSANAEHQAQHIVEFVPNRAFVMPNAAHALHGVVGGEPGVVRKTVMCGYWQLAPNPAAG